MHFCRAEIAIGGDDRNIMHLDNFSPVSWPEILVLQFLHGEDSVNRIMPFVRVEQSPRAERQRLIAKYSEPVILQVFARQNPSDMEAPKAILPNGHAWFNPITQRHEITGETTLAEPFSPDPAESEPEPAMELADASPDYYDAPPEPTRRRR